MSTQVTVDLPDDVYRRVEQFARLANRDLSSILAETIQLFIPPVSPNESEFEPISSLSDEQVLALTELQMEPEQDVWLSLLLDHQQAGILSDEERPELLTLMQIYQERLLRKATALSESVKRGLMEPLSE
jgi:hypothetical protein